MPASSTSSSSGFSRIEIPLKPSPGLGLLAATPWLLPAAVVLQLEALPFAVPASIVLVCTAGGVTAFRRQLLRARNSPVQLLASPEGLQAILRNGRQHRLHISPGSRIAHRFLWLHLKGHGYGSAQPLLLSTIPGIRNTDPQQLRRLTGWLRLGPARTDDTCPMNRFHGDTE
ncbi:hypothetical protein ACMDCT_00395 [Halomonadaceae bacterium KBTZ08]